MSWLDAFSSEADIQNQMNQLKFTTELPQPKPAFSYTTGLVCCYSVAVSLMVFILFRRLWRIARHGANIGFGRSRTVSFFLRQVPLTIAVAIWSGFLLGSVMAAIVSGLLWITT
ncbi:hypothetical protein DBR46_09020 [Pseudomonas sp. KBW05]|nr:hypothetical protein DBR46_09020 [Pseudomonas sp. KBW05]